MKRIETCLAALKKEGRKMLSPYLTAGDPSLEASLKLMHILVEKGADILEIGIPFSDPMSEGSVIQAAMERALKQAVSTDDVLDLVAEFRKSNKETPIVVMGYLNPIEVYGYQAFAEKASKVGVDGTILVDLPPEEATEVVALWAKHNLASIFLCSPTTTDARIAKINHYANAYLYFVSLKGVSGSSALDIEAVKERYQHIKQLTSLPVMVGFGIKTAKMAEAIAEFADGIVVGAALIEKIAQADPKNQGIIAGDFIQSLRLALDHGF